MITPLSLLFGLFLGLLAIALPIVGVLLLLRAAHPPVRYVHPVQRERVDGHEVDTEVAPVRPLAWRERWREPAVLVPLLLGAFLLTLPLFGRYLVQYAFHPGSDEPVPLHGEVHGIARGDGTTIHAETFGPAGAPTLVLSHGWGTDGTEWYYAKKALAGSFRVIVWDLPGMGETEQPRDRDYSQARFATDLHTVVTALSPRQPVVLVGHSIGGMTNLTFCGMYAQALGRQVAGVVEVDTSYTDPVKTAKNSSLNEALQKPVAEPLLHAMIPLSEVIRAANWLSYQEGLLYLSNASSAFAGTETRGQLDLVSRYQFQALPSAVARGTLGMFHWDATPVLETIHVPVLILVGNKDTTTLPSASETMHAKIGGSALQVVAPGNHYSLLERHEEVDDAIASFASQVLGSAK